jgi:hypothetical protein
VQTWDGSAWTVRPGPAPGPLGTGSVAEIDCLAVDRCLARVSRPTAQSGGAQAVLWWDGTTWSGVPGVPVPTALAYAEQSCFVGGCVVADYASGQMISWDGATFASVASSTYVRGNIACVSADDCVANGGDHNFASRWNGATWTEVPGTFTGATMTGIDCATSTDRCVAIGHDDFLAPTLATWDGDGWTYHAVPDGASPLIYPSGVSCASGSECVVAGVSSFLPGSDPGQLAWNGSDWFVATAAPSMPDASYSAISCTPLWCMAVGQTIASPAQRVAATYTWTNT